MRYQIKINPVDLQDRDGFCAYLKENARCGLQAVSVFPGWSIFKRTDAAPIDFDMFFDMKQSSTNDDNICRVYNGVCILPDRSQTRQDSWAENVCTFYNRFTLNWRSQSLLQFSSKLITATILILWLLYWNYTTGGAWEFLQLRMPFEKFVSVIVTVVTLLIPLLAIKFFKSYVNSLHLRGMKKALVEKLPYRTLPETQRLVFIKNALNVLVAPVLFLVLGAYLYLMA